MSFVHLRMHTAYSLCEGAIKISNIPALCAKHHMPAVAMTDTDNLFGALEFSLECAKHGIQPIIGCTVTLEDANKLVLLAKSEAGYRNLVRIVSQAYLASDHYKKVPLSVLTQHQDELIALSCYDKGVIGYYLNQGQKDEAYAAAQTYQNIFGDRFYMDIARHHTTIQEAIETPYIQIAHDLHIPLVATNEVFFANKDDYEAHDALLCIASGRYMYEDNRRKETPEHYFKSSEEMQALFHDLPEALENATIVAKRCAFMIKALDPQLPLYQSDENVSEMDLLRQKAAQGLEVRLISVNNKQPYYERLEYELGILEKMGFAGYFLIVADFIQWAKSQHIPVGPGRGSGAGSVVAWALTITDMDPIHYNLLFERFLNPERVSMPDFDIDFCQSRRDEVIQYVKERYGYKRVAHIITFGTLQTRAALRDVGRVLQIPYPKVDRICKLVPSIPITVQEALPYLEAEMQEDPDIEKMVNIAGQLEGLYRHASTHAAGIVIGHTDLENIVPLYREPDSETLTTQFSMKYVELAGLLKFDFLGLKTLTVIEDCCHKIGGDFNINRIPLDDNKTFQLLCGVSTTGIFQLESSGMQDVVAELQPDRFEDLIALVALYRPGPMDDIPRYLACKHGREDIQYLHPLLEPILKTTYGVMVYQEQVMQIAQTLAGYSLGEADLLRRAMGKKIKTEMAKQRRLFMDKAVKKGIKENIAEKIFDQMAKFAGYGFNKSHAAPYALLTYQTAYLKANYPKVFFASLMTLDMQNTDKLDLYRQDLQKMRIPLYAPCVNRSSSEFIVEQEGIRFGLAAIKNVGETAIDNMLHERPKEGFTSLSDFAKVIAKTGINKRQLEYLVLAGAMDAVHHNRRELFESSDALLKYGQKEAKSKQSAQRSLFDHQDTIQLSALSDWPSDERLHKEMEAIGFYLSAHPIAMYRQHFPYATTHIVDIASLQTDAVSFAALLKNKRERISKNGKPYAFLELADDTGTIDAIIFQEQLTQFQSVLQVDQPIMVRCAIKRDPSMRLSVTHVDCLKKSIQKMPVKIRLHDIHDVKVADTIKKIEAKGATTLILAGEYEGYLFQLSIPGLDIDVEKRNNLAGI